MAPAGAFSDRNLASCNVFRVFPVPPSVYTHYEIVDIDASFGIESVLIGQVDKDQHADDSKWVNQNAFLLAKPDT